MKNWSPAYQIPQLLANAVMREPLTHHPVTLPGPRCLPSKLPLVVWQKQAKNKRPADENPLQKHTEDVIITGTSYTEPGNPTVLVKHSAKEELPTANKGKLNVDLQNYAQFNPGELHAGYLSRLHTSRDMEAGLINLMVQKYEEALTLKETELGDLAKKIKHQEAETVKAESKFQFAVKENEKLKENFATERAAFETEKSNLIKRAEDTEAQLKPVAEELAGLKGHITHMKAAIFGPRSASLGQDMLLKLKAIYSLTEQLYSGALRSLVVLGGNRKPPS